MSKTAPRCTRTRTSTLYFPGGRIVVGEPATGPIIVKVYGFADRVSTPSHAGDGPIVVEIRRTA